LSEGRGLVEGKVFFLVDIEEEIQYPFDDRVSQKKIGTMREDGTKPAKKIELTENPIPKGPSLFIQIFGLCNEVQFRNINTRRANRIAKMATDTEVNPLIHRRVIWPSEPLNPWTCLFWTWEEGGDPRNRTDCHAGSTADTNICVTFRPTFFHIDKYAKC
jgi:hypothetical protein